LGSVVLAVFVGAYSLLAVYKANIFPTLVMNAAVKTDNRTKLGFCAAHDQERVAVSFRVELQTKIADGALGGKASARRSTHQLAVLDSPDFAFAAPAVELGPGKEGRIESSKFSRDRSDHAAIVENLAARQGGAQLLHALGRHFGLGKVQVL